MGLIKYLNKYYKIQKDISLVYRPNEKSSWSRVEFMGDKYNPHTRYNHRSLLRNEVVIEYDTDDINVNKMCADLASRKLKKDNIRWAKWYSGNKSVHLHFLINPKKAKRLNLLKSAFLQEYGIFYLKNQRISPDFRLCGSNSLIRAEYGIHEKTNKKKKLVSKDKEYPTISEVPAKVWNKYCKMVKAILKQKVSKIGNDVLNSKGFKFLLDSDRLRITDDGRERAMFMLIHCLKPQYKEKQDLVKFIQEWYRYSSGRKLTPQQIARKVYYHWNKKYTITKQYLNNLLYELGKEELIE